MLPRNSNSVPEARAAASWTLARRFAIAGASIGFFAGVLEAALLFFIPRASGLLHPDVRYVIWFIAPLVDLLAGALLGLIVGFLGSSRRASGVTHRVVAAAIGLGLFCAYAVWMMAWFGRIVPQRVEITAPILCFVIVFAGAFLLFGRSCRLATPRRMETTPRPPSHLGHPLTRDGARVPQAGESRAREPDRNFQGWLFRGSIERFFFAGGRVGLNRWLAANVVLIVVLVAGIFLYAVHHQPRILATETPARVGVVSGRPNVVLIVLDTVRADHLSCYGYSRPTTPRLDRLARHGVLFQNVVAPSSWTLPSLVSIFTGLLPHQHGADWRSAMSAAPWTLAKILHSKGYETAGFNANPYYGLGGWRLDEGFEIYDDDSYTLRHNLAVTFVGQSALRFVYNRLIRYNQFDHRDADDVNRDVMSWWHRRHKSRPFFLFVNYMDAHRPYLPPAPWDHRFGRIPHRLLAGLTAPLKDGHPSKPYTARERQDLMDGYDNSLAYLDDRVGRLVQFLTAQPGGKNTIFIVSADHGEGFREHGTYDHGWNLYPEVLHVPLVIAGPGVPQGVRVPYLVPSRKLFSTVLDLALGLKGPIAQSSLCRYWHRGFEPTPQESEVVSELNIYGPANDPASLRFTTPDWHLMWSSGGRMELYDSKHDPEDKINLIARPNAQETLQNLETSLESRIAWSVLPWRSLAYLSPLDERGANFIQQVSDRRLRLTPEGIPIGAAQALFSHQRPSQLLKPSQSEQDLLRSLPYH
ncbi:MAG: sulfatase [Terriglobia bacterium]